MQTVKFQSTNVKKGDLVHIIAGREKGKTGKVLRVLRCQGRILVEGLNLVKRHTKPSQTNPQGGVISKEGSIHYSNVMLHCAKCNKGVRVGHRLVNKDRVRVCKKCDSAV